MTILDSGLHFWATMYITMGVLDFLHAVVTFSEEQSLSAHFGPLMWFWCSDWGGRDGMARSSFPAAPQSPISPAHFLLSYVYMLTELNEGDDSLITFAFTYCPKL